MASRARSSSLRGARRASAGTCRRSGHICRRWRRGTRVAASGTRRSPPLLAPPEPVPPPRPPLPIVPGAFPEAALHEARTILAKIDRSDAIRREVFLSMSSPTSGRSRSNGHATRRPQGSPGASLRSHGIRRPPRQVCHVAVAPQRPPPAGAGDWGDSGPPPGALVRSLAMKAPAASAVVLVMLRTAPR